MQGKNYVTGLKMLKAYPQESDGLCAKANENVAEGQNWSSLLMALPLTKRIQLFVLDPAFMFHFCIDLYKVMRYK